MGGGFFDNMWDPYSGAYAYPRAQPRARYYRPRAPVYEQHPLYERRPVYEQHPAYEQGASVQPENHFPGKVKVEDSARKAVRTIPVTDGSVPVEVKLQPVEVNTQPVARFESEDAAARKIQAVYRGYSVRRTEPLKHLRVIAKVKEEFEGFKRRLKDREVRARVAGDAQEKLRWTEGIMALLLRLDQLQGVHPEVRVFRRAAAKELLMFQEKLDSMSDVVVEEDVEGDVGEEKVVGDGCVAEEKSEVCDAAEEEAEVDDGNGNVSAAEAMEEMEVEEDNVDDVNVEDATQAETEGAPANEEHQEEMEVEAGLREDEVPVEVSKDATQAEIECAPANGEHEEGMEMEAGLREEEAPVEVSKDATQVEAESAVANDARQETMEQDATALATALEEGEDQDHTSDGVNVTEIPPSVEHVPHEEVTSSEDRSGLPSDRIGASMVGDAEQDGLNCRILAETLMDAEDGPSTMAPATVEAGSLVVAPALDVDQEDASGVEDGPSTDLGVSPSKEAEGADSTEKNENHDVGSERLAERLELDNNGDGPLMLEERATDAWAMEPGEGWIVSTSSTSMEPPQYSAKSLQAGEPQIISSGDTNSLSDRALLEQLLEENRKLKDVVGKVLHWGKQQNDIIHSLASRIEHLEEQQPQAKMLAGEQMNGRKRICNDGGLVGDRERSQRSKGRRKGRQSNRHQLGYLDSEWLSADSDEYF